MEWEKIHERRKDLGSRQISQTKEGLDMIVYIRQRLEIIRLRTELKFHKEQEDILLRMIVEMAPAVMFVEGVKNIGKKKTT